MGPELESTALALAWERPMSTRAILRKELEG